MRRSISEELDAQERHGKWARWWTEDADKRPEHQPPPAYRDCANCKYSGEPEPIRRSYCVPCVWEGEAEPLPVSPSERFLMAHLLARLPQGIVECMPLSFDLHLDVETVRRRTAPRLF